MAKTFCSITKLHITKPRRKNLYTDKGYSIVCPCHNADMIWSGKSSLLAKRALDDANVERHGQTSSDDRVYSDNATGATPHRK